MESTAFSSSTLRLPKRHHDDHDDRDAVLPELKKHATAQGVEGNQHHHPSIFSRECSIPEAMNTDVTVSEKPMSQKDNSLFFCQRIKLALQQILTTKGENDQAKEAYASFLEKILYDTDIQQMWCDTSYSSKPQDTLIRAFSAAVGVQKNTVEIGIAIITDCAIHTLVENPNLIAGLFFVLLQHPYYKSPDFQEEGVSPEVTDRWHDAEDAINLDSALYLLIACADFLLYSKHSDFFGFGEDSILSDCYFESVVKRVILYKEEFVIRRHASVFPLMLANECWWQSAYFIKGDHTTITSSFTKEKLAEFIEKTLSPEWLCAILFEEDSLFDQQLLSSLDGLFPSSDFHCFDSTKVLVGEEFEYEIPLPEGKTICDYADLTKEAMRQWSEEIKEMHSEAVIVHNLDQTNRSQDDDAEEEKVTIKIGSWEVEAFQEPATENGCPVVEFTASPYSMNQTFFVGDRQYSSYELLQRVVIEPAKRKGWVECSGHKHIDISGSIGNNTELLLRLLVDIENKSWLSIITQQAAYAKDYFPYIAQEDHSLQRQMWLKTSLEHVNEKIRQSASPSTGNTFLKVNQLDTWWLRLAGHGLFRGPGSIRYHSPQTPDEVIKGKVSDPMTTFEFRFFHCSRNSTEVRLINQLLVAWIDHLSTQQQSREPLIYDAEDPMQISHEQAVEKFKAFVEELGLCWEEYSVLIRHPTKNQTVTSIHLNRFFR